MKFLLASLIMLAVSGYVLYKNAISHKLAWDKNDEADPLTIVGYFTGGFIFIPGLIMLIVGLVLL
ncbi:hypothetical protein CL614_00335 [archaeon]|nr:hypothetical protein [archaeon]|tara:strand:- start:489 stop:683 length:195 start_codon:yes stop_codon:yes gene_type:complete